MDELDKDIHKKKYSHHMLMKGPQKIGRASSSNLDGLAAADVATIINGCKQPSNDFIYQTLYPIYDMITWLFLTIKSAKQDLT
jgi:hypothetical protein